MSLPYYAYTFGNIESVNENIAKKICKFPYIIEAGSNYIKHKNFVIIENNINVYKVYNDINKLEECIYKFNWAHDALINFSIPVIIDSFVFENKSCPSGNTTAHLPFILSI